MSYGQDIRCVMAEAWPAFKREIRGEMADFEGRVTGAIASQASSLNSLHHIVKGTRDELVTAFKHLEARFDVVNEARVSAQVKWDDEETTEVRSRRVESFRSLKAEKDEAVRAAVEAERQRAAQEEKSSKDRRAKTIYQVAGLLIAFGTLTLEILRARGH